MDKVKKRLKQLAKEIRHHSHLYYVECAPEITDAEFDTLLDELLAIEKEHPEWVTPDSPSQRVGAPLSGVFPVVKHSSSLLSLAKVNKEKDLTKWLEGVTKESLKMVKENFVKKEKAIQIIKDIRSGTVIERDHFPESLKGDMAKKHWNNNLLIMGMHYGVILALIDIFKLDEKDLK
jgi:DNA ligase (NAD+)